MAEKKSPGFPATVALEANETGPADAFVAYLTYIIHVDGHRAAGRGAG